ncbi:molybdopterin-dependent oxidoreductase [Sphingobium sp. AR-3-1]|uniref:Molybdopterin-dependent oxidoreductase n=1 Tax=Sphingobium psychrophilum TaxID=2728834 RepID=A0A7X9ZS74_9SPHN|nr:molybdopterin-dependent oxidoreductase [Sphingobium psychrophilum]NML08874.1 molybdopterin-dependent oxidoreductase [Sphingobium psychrophilum]
MTAIKTLCGRCAMGCGVRAMTGLSEDDARRVFIEGDRIHPTNMGWLCPAGETLAADTGLDGRLLHPLLAGKRVSQDRAIAHAARRLSDIIAQHGPTSVALHVAGDLPTEDYFAANKLMKGFIGSAHIDVPWHDISTRTQIAAFGEDMMPASAEDVDGADLILAIGAGVLRRHPMLARRVASAREERGAQLVIVDPDPDARLLPADHHLAPAPGSVAALLGGLLLRLHDAELVDRAFLAQHVTVPDGYWEALRPGHDLWSVSGITDLPIRKIREFQDIIASAPRTVTIFDPDAGEGDAPAAAAILALHLAMGRIGQPGAAPFALPGAPNAMGAREVGCIATVLAAHRDFSADALASVSRFWSTHKVVAAPGLSGHALRQAIGDGAIKALLMLGNAPDALLDAMPDQRPFTLFAGDRLDPAMADRIDLAMPMPGPLEREGTITGADRLISRQRPVFALPGEARPGWWIVTRIGRAMGWHDAFHYERSADIYREHARLSVYQGEGRLFDLRRHAPLSNPAYHELTPWRWGEVPFHGGHFPTSDGRARLARFWD